MHGLLKAVGQHQKGRRIVAAALSAFTIAAIGLSVPSYSATSPKIGVDPVTTSAIQPQKAPHELRFELTRKGWEGVELAARLHELGGLIQRPIKWTIRRLLVAEGQASELVLRQSASVINSGLEPGDYLIEVEYGFHKVSQSITIEPGHRIALTFILNVGGIRALSRVHKLDLPAGISTRHAIYALSGHGKGRLIATGFDQGQVFRLGAGKYRIESRFSPGNTIAQHTVTVKPGILNSTELAHQAGLARITVGASLNAAVAWEIRNLDGSWTSGHTTPETALVLAPGDYEIKAIVNGTVVRQRFAIGQGDYQHVRVGLTH